MNKNSLVIESRIWIRGSRGAYLGEGRIALLRAIDREGSLTKAAASMSMSYLKAWRLLHSMNSQAGRPLTVQFIGGVGGGGTHLTPAGREAIEVYTELKRNCDQYLIKELNRVARRL